MTRKHHPELIYKPILKPIVWIGQGKYHLYFPFDLLNGGDLMDTLVLRLILKLIAVIGLDRTSTICISCSIC